jgi:hypothetical protein
VTHQHLVRVALFLGAMVIGLLAPGCAAGRDPDNGFPITGDQWVRTELFCGMGQSDGSAVSEGQWLDFLNDSVSPRFPEGLTSVAADGRYRSDDGVIHREPTRILIILYPRSQLGEAQRKLEMIAQEYIKRFHQTSVLKADQWVSVRFIERPAAQAATAPLRPAATVGMMP